MTAGRGAAPWQWFGLLLVLASAAGLFLGVAHLVMSAPRELSHWRIDAAGVSRMASESGGSYRLLVPLTAPPAEPRALFMPQAAGRVDVFLNGVPIGGGGGAGPAAHSGVPLLLLLPAALTRDGINMLEVRATGVRWATDPLYVGPVRTLRPAHERALAVQVRARQIILGVLGGVSMMTGLLFWLRPGDRHHGWFSLTVMASAVHLAAGLYQGASAWWRVLEDVALVCAVGSAVLFVHRSVGARSGAIERAVLWGGPLLAAATLVAQGVSAMPAVAALACHAAALAAGIHVVLYLVRALHRQWDPRNALLLIVAALMVIVHGADQWRATAVPLLPYTAFPVLVVIGALILHRFVVALKESEASNRGFEASVAARNRELQASLARLESIRREQALSAERQRLMRDMHDGVGGQLLQAVSSVEADPALHRLAVPLRESLADLRLVVDALGHADGDLADALATMRWRVGRRLAQAQLRLQWDGGGEALSARLPAACMLRVLRAIQRGVDAVMPRTRTMVGLRLRMLQGETGEAIHLEITGDDGETLACSVPVNRRTVEHIP